MNKAGLERSGDLPSSIRCTETIEQFIGDLYDDTTDDDDDDDMEEAVGMEYWGGGTQKEA